jgi:hypothetical protein
MKRLPPSAPGARNSPGGGRNIGARTPRILTKKQVFDGAPYRCPVGVPASARPQTRRSGSHQGRDSARDDSGSPGAGWRHPDYPPGGFPTLSRCGFEGGFSEKAMPGRGACSNPCRPDRAVDASSPHLGARRQRRWRDRRRIRPAILPFVLAGSWCRLLRGLGGHGDELGRRAWGGSRPVRCPAGAHVFCVARVVFFTSLGFDPGAAG